MRGHEVASAGTSEVNHLGTPETLRYNRSSAKVATSQTDPKEVTQMVTDRKEDNEKTPEKQGTADSAPEPNKINCFHTLRLPW